MKYTDLYKSEVAITTSNNKSLQKLMKSAKAAQHNVQLTALRHWLAVSFSINVILLAVTLYAIGGN